MHQQNENPAFFPAEVQLVIEHGRLFARALGDSAIGAYHLVREAIALFPAAVRHVLEAAGYVVPGVVIIGIAPAGPLNPPPTLQATTPMEMTAGLRSTLMPRLMKPGELTLEEFLALVLSSPCRRLELYLEQIGVHREGRSLAQKPFQGTSSYVKSAERSFALRREVLRAFGAGEAQGPGAVKAIQRLEEHLGQHQARLTGAKAGLPWGLGGLALDPIERAVRDEFLVTTLFGADSGQPGRVGYSCRGLLRILLLDGYPRNIKRGLEAFERAQQQDLIEAVGSHRIGLDTGIALSVSAQDELIQALDNDVIGTGDLEALKRRLGESGGP